MTTTTLASPAQAMLSQANTWSALQTFGNNISIGGAAFNIASITKGDVIYYDGTNLVNLAIGSANQVLTVSGGVPTWTGAAVSSVFGRTGVVVAVNTDYATAGLSGTSLSGVYNIGGTPTLTATTIAGTPTYSGLATFNAGIQSSGANNLTLNVPTGQTIIFQINNVTVAQISSTTLTLTGINILPSTDIGISIGNSTSRINVINLSALYVNNAAGAVLSQLTSTGIVSVSTGFAFSVQSLSANTTLTAGGYSVNLVDATGAARTITLPAASAQKGIYIVVVKTDSSANAVTVAAAGTDTIEGAASLSLATQYKKSILVSDGTSKWYDLSASLV